MRKIPRNGIRDGDIKHIIEQGGIFNVTVMQESLFSSHYRFFLDYGSGRFELYSQRGKPKTFASVDSVVKYCQSMGIRQFVCVVEQRQDAQ